MRRALLALPHDRGTTAVASAALLLRPRGTGPCTPAGASSRGLGCSEAGVAAGVALLL